MIVGSLPLKKCYGDTHWTIARVTFPTDEEASGWLLGRQDDVALHLKEEKH